MKNTKNLASKRFYPFFNLWANYLFELGYIFFYKVLNVNDYGAT